MILQYEKWKKINEETASDTQAYLNFNFGKGKTEKILPGTAVDASLAAIPFFKRAYPGAELLTHGFAGISFPNTSYENVDGEKEDLVLKFDDLIKSSSSYSMTGDSTYSSAHRELVFPEFIKKDILKSITKQVINKSDEDYEILVADSYAHLEEPQIREKMIALAKEHIDKKLDVNLSGTDLADSIEVIMVQNSLGDIFKDSAEELRLMRISLAQYALNKITELINSLQFKKELVNLQEFTKQIEKRSSKFLIDYSKLKEAEIKAMISALQEYLYYLNKTLRKRGGTMQELGITNIKAILRHISQYPEVAELIYAS